MTPEEKAKELVRRFSAQDTETPSNILFTPLGKRCALICVQEIIMSLLNEKLQNAEAREEIITHWQQVKEYLTMEENKK